MRIISGDNSCTYCHDRKAGILFSARSNTAADYCADSGNICQLVKKPQQGKIPFYCLLLRMVHKTNEEHLPVNGQHLPNTIGNMLSIQYLGLNDFFFFSIIKLYSYKGKRKKKLDEHILVSFFFLFIFPSSTHKIIHILQERSKEEIRKKWQISKSAVHKHSLRVCFKAEPLAKLLQQQD